MQNKEKVKYFCCRWKSKIIGVHALTVIVKMDFIFLLLFIIIIIYYLFFIIILFIYWLSVIFAQGTLRRWTEVNFVGQRRELFKTLSDHLSLAFF